MPAMSLMSLMRTYRFATIYVMAVGTAAVLLEWVVRW